MIPLPPVDRDGSLWVFGYGSLMWHPGFSPSEVEPARLNGYQRRFCIYSVHHRGSPERPGLVLGLDRGGTCDGLALRIAPGHRREILGYLRSREQINGVYRETQVQIELAGQSGRRIPAVAFMTERAHPSYAGQLPIREQARIIRAASGQSGGNLEYLFATLDQLDRLNIRDSQLIRLLTVVGPFFAGQQRNSGHTMTRTDSLRSRGHSMGGVRMSCRRFEVGVPLMRPDQRRRFIHRSRIAAWRNRSD